MSDWQPIETAPKDGTHVDLWVIDDAGDRSRIPSAYWRDDISAWWGVEWVNETPTHWMPLPGPPKEHP